MKREDFIRMARDAGFVDYELDDYTPSGYDIRYERFASLVAASAKAEEREACAKVCDEQYYQHLGQEYGEVRYGIAACAAAIRARGQS